MNHLSQERLIEHHYGEDQDSEASRQHLSQCGRCSQRYAELRAVLEMADAFQVPPRGQEYGTQVYERLQVRLQESRKSSEELRPVSLEPGASGIWQRLVQWRPPRLLWVPALALLLVAAFLTGRYWEAQRGLDAQQVAEARRGVLLLEVGRHLQQAGYLLAEVGNVPPRDGTQMDFERRKASEMAADGWIFGRAAQETGDPALVETLEQLQRFLLDIANGPTTWTAQEIEALQTRLEEAGLPMRIRVLEDRVRRQQIEAARSRARRSL
ncbi:MAG TPA: hypothetical protein VLV83_08325 [Acidobacteriota bacterium]|nr:hypothetical protein [Acidobacteriota bacterium]